MGKKEKILSRYDCSKFFTLPFTHFYRCIDSTSYSLTCTIDFRFENKYHSFLKINTYYSSIRRWIRSERLSNILVDWTGSSKATQVLSTRVYAILLAVSLVILVLFVFLSKTTVFVTETKPSIDTYRRLQAAYPSTLSCLCEHISVSNEDFLSITPTYHQVRPKHHM
jgi:hypothetical protein